MTATPRPPGADPQSEAPSQRDADLIGLADDVERALDDQRVTLHFNARLESQFESDLADSRIRRYRIWGLVATLMYNLFNVTDRVMLPDILNEALWVRLGLVTPILVLTSLFLHRAPLREWRELLVSAELTLVAGSVIYLFSRSLHPNAMQYHSGVTLILMFGTIVARQRFGYAMATCALIFIMYAVGVFGLYDMSSDVKINCVMVQFGAITISLMANYQMEFDVRRGYLNDLKQRIEAGRLRRSRDELDQLSKSDPLTGLDNRRSFDSRLQAEWSRAQRNQESIALLYVDIDHFKAYNDRYGHQAGDTCLVQVAQTIRDSAHRGTDLCARYGGEEFVVLLPQTTAEHALAIAKRMCLAVERLGVDHDASPTAPVVTVSIGVASAIPMAHAPWPMLLEQADKALYWAKNSGRNRVTVFESRPT